MAILLRPTDFLSGLLRVWSDPTPRRMNILLAAFTRDWLLAWICRALQPTTVRTQSTVALQGEPHTVPGARMRSCKPSNDELPGLPASGYQNCRNCQNLWEYVIVWSGWWRSVGQIICFFLVIFTAGLSSGGSRLGTLPAPGGFRSPMKQFRLVRD